MNDPNATDAWDQLNILAAVAHNTAVKNGWWSSYGAPAHGTETPTDARFLEAIALVMSEAAEAIERWREGQAVAEMTWSYKTGPNPMVMHGKLIREDGKTWYQSGPHREDRVEMTHDRWLAAGYTAEPGGVPSELADILIRVFDTCGAWGVDIGAATKAKMEFNSMRPYRHGGKKA